MGSLYRILDPSAPSVGGGCALAVMIKAPRAGASKTRLVPPLTHEEAAALSVCFLRDTAANIAAACEAAAGLAHGVAVYTPVGAEAAFDDLLPANFSLLAQRGDTFGERLLHAAEDLLASGFDSLCLIDSDSPTLPTRALINAVEQLSESGERLVIGAADDGGYCLIGLKAAHARLFAAIEWSTPRVFAQTIERAREIALPVVELPAWYDVDDAPTLARLCEELFGTSEAAASCDPTAAPGVEGCDDLVNEDSGSNPDADRRMNAHGDAQLIDHADAVDNAVGYAATHTLDFLARLIEREGGARIWREGGAESDETRSSRERGASLADTETTP